MPPASAAQDAEPASLIVPFDRARRRDVPSLGGKGANLGEMTSARSAFGLAARAYEQEHEERDDE